MFQCSVRSLYLCIKRIGEHLTVLDLEGRAIQYSLHVSKHHVIILTRQQQAC